MSLTNMLVIFLMKIQNNRLLDMKILHIGKEIDKPTSGGEQISARNQYFLKDIQKSELSYINLDDGYFASRLLCGVSGHVLKQIDILLSTNTYTHVFISQSYLGRVAYFIRKKYPNIIIVIFYHNIEFHFAKEAYRVHGIKAIPSIIISYIWESISTKIGNILITLNSRDDKLLKKVYNRSSDINLPTSLPDMFDKSRIITSSSTTEINYLFVGVAFFANIEAITWFIDHVMPHIPGTLHIVGKGMDAINFTISDRVKVSGFVEDLSLFYYNANFVVAPILSGGGMKTKTAEALMYGKTIIGTTEAFEGYEHCKSCMHICNTKEEFTSLINKLVELHQIKCYNPASRELFVRNYSHSAVYKSLCNIL